MPQHASSLRRLPTQAVTATPNCTRAGRGERRGRECRLSLITTAPLTLPTDACLAHGTGWEDWESPLQGEGSNRRHGVRNQPALFGFFFFFLIRFFLFFFYFLLFCFQKKDLCYKVLITKCLIFFLLSLVTHWWSGLGKKSKRGEIEGTSG